jgi:epoxide hydrolase
VYRWFRLGMKTGGMSDDVTPFRVDIPEADIDDLRDRLRRTRWPEPETVDDWSQGTPVAYARELCKYWLEEYDWYAARTRLNRFPQFLTTIEGLDIHFIHVQSPNRAAVPLVITHGWPGSVVEFSKVIESLTDPVALGGDPADAFHVVCPSLPGFGFSGKPARPGWGAERIADAWDQLMARLGYLRRAGTAGDVRGRGARGLPPVAPTHC